MLDKLDIDLLIYIYIEISTCFEWNKQALDMIEHVLSKPRVRPDSNNTSKQYDILITRGGMKTLAIRSDFDFKFSRFRVLI